MVIPAALQHASHYKPTMEDYLTYLKTFDSIEVHDFMASNKSQTRMQYPVSLPAYKVVKRLQDTSGRINLLNLHDTQENTTPDFLLGIRAFRPTLELKASNACGKNIDLRPRELLACERFSIVGTRGVFSFPHIDHCGVVTFLKVRHGRKGWVTWPFQDETDFESFCYSGSPRGRPFYLSAGEGDWIVQPAGTVHAPISLSLVWLTGLMRPYA